MTVKAYESGRPYTALMPFAFLVFGGALIPRGARRRARRERERLDALAEPPRQERRIEPDPDDDEWLSEDDSDDAVPRGRAMDLKCPNCAASSKHAQVSPRGDVQCEHCGTWFDAYRR